MINMKKTGKFTILLLILANLFLIACGKDEKKDDTENKKEDKVEANVSTNLSEEELQIAKGVNGDLPDPVYTYEAIVDEAGGLYQSPQPNENNYSKKLDKWKEDIQRELKKIGPALDENASEEEIQRLFKQLLYIVGYDYTPYETVDRFSYVIFKNDMENPFTHEKIEENMNVNVEIVLDASGSMIKKIGDKTMMEIAKESIKQVLSEMPANAKVGIRVFGHKGDNTASKKDESCGANELIYPIGDLNVEEIEKALEPIQPTGWTSIAKSIEYGVEDLKVLDGEKTLNILYIITDGIETCGGNPVEIAKQLKGENTNIILGIIGFNVDANQNRLLKQIADAAGGYYSSVNDADKLTGELYRINELAFSDYKWEVLNDNVINRVKGMHKEGLVFNKISHGNKGISEKVALSTAIQYGSVSSNNDPKFAGLYKAFGKVSKRLGELSEERKNKIDAIFEEEYKKLEKESEEYIAYLESRKGEMVAYIPSTSRVSPRSAYFTGTSNKGGTREDVKKDAEKIKEEKEVAKQ
ncbi:vWA domain-containing protein [Fusobacterium nucleatum]|uniref:vWA domain-containing protein n=1 Tax=Fusobacterium nucleatum TaxID=851 RepID=UPI000411C576|nr:VWA domain-containing protein [Fusobacterium nucleatum]